MSDSTSVALFSILLQVIGWTFILRAATALCRGIYVYFVRGPTNLSRLGQWAVITGATDGIGKAYAFALTKRGPPKPDDHLSTIRRVLVAQMPPGTQG